MRTNAWLQALSALMAISAVRGESNALLRAHLPLPREKRISLFGHLILPEDRAPRCLRIGYSYTCSTAVRLYLKREQTCGLDLGSYHRTKPVATEPKRVECQNVCVNNVKGT